MEGAAELAAVEQLLQGLVLGVVAAHEADAREPSAARGLRLGEPQRTARVGGEGLLAQDGQAALEAAEERRLVRLRRRGDEHRLDPGGVESGQRVRVQGAARQVSPRRPRPVRVRVGDGRDARTAHHPVETSYVVGAHVPGAEHRDSQCLAHPWPPD
ncbi:hypothetical protein GA0115252_167828 [Streptomyces sp. DfronAA-171]|nr:hypothetical protein GA0115252_167828 [Streptomyces sp. DfronAA-171]